MNTEAIQTGEMAISINKADYISLSDISIKINKDCEITLAKLLNDLFIRITELENNQLH